ncbi:MAG: peptide deformylase [Clostridia bacterium]|nr:peptide deformylase [Clostridia bacterium]
MALRQIRKDGDEILRKKSREVAIDDITGEKIQSLIDDMIETMHYYNGVGLAAVQVGLLKRVVVIDVEDGHGVYVLINPVITKTKGERECDEGCLSFPNEYGKVVRPDEVTVEYYDRTGKKMRLKAKDLLAQAVSHECDHLEGILFVDNVIPGTLEYITPEDNK